jgi:hypothetical protein
VTLRSDAGREEVVHVLRLAAVSRPRDPVRLRDGSRRRGVDRGRWRGHDDWRGHLEPLLRAAGTPLAPEAVVEQEPGHEDAKQEQRSTDSAIHHLAARPGRTGDARRPWWLRIGRMIA